MNYDYITNLNPGLGDCLSVFTTNLPCASPSPCFPILRKFSSIPVFRGEGVELRTELLHTRYPGQHLFNKARLAAGMEPLKEPKALLDKIEYKPVKGRIAFSMDVGLQALNQRRLIHPRARVLYPEHRITIQQFIKDHAEIEFIEIGKTTFDFEGVKVSTGENLEKTIEILSTCDKTIVMTSGLQHLSLAIGIKTAAIINFPAPEKVGNPNEEESDWLEPQVFYLHEDGECDPIKFLNRDNLEYFINE